MGNTIVGEVLERRRFQVAEVAADRTGADMNPIEQQVFRRLSVFRGGFTCEAAEAVVGASLGLLASLVHKSLLRRIESGATRTPRYEVHELVRQFAAEQLATMPDEQATVEERHSAFYLTFVAERERRIFRRPPAVP